MAMDESKQQQRDPGMPQADRQPQDAQQAEQQQQQQQQSDEPPGVEPDRIDVDDEDAVADWAARLDVSPDQILEAVDVVGDLASDVEMHLKGTRSTTNADRLDELDDEA